MKSANEIAVAWLRDWYKGKAFAFNNHDVDRLTAAIEADRREVIEACAKAALTAKAHAGDCDCQFCSYLLRGIAAIRSLSPKGTTPATKEVTRG